MDLNIAIAKIYPDAKYRLSQANPPHKIIEWRDVREQPTEQELKFAWDDYNYEKEVINGDINDLEIKGANYFMKIEKRIGIGCFTIKLLEVTS